MKLSTKTRYGTRMILDMAQNHGQGAIQLGEIANRQNISLKYLEQLTAKLKKAGLINSHRGSAGGHMLAKSPDDITIGQIVRVLEETAVITDCAEQEKQVCGVCNRAGECLSRWVWVEASRAMFDRLDQITVADLLATENKNLKKH